VKPNLNCIKKVLLNTIDSEKSLVRKSEERDLSYLPSEEDEFHLHLVYWKRIAREHKIPKDFQKISYSPRYISK